MNGREGWAAKAAKTCAWEKCGKPFVAKAPAQKYCSNECRIAAFALQTVNAQGAKSAKRAARLAPAAQPAAAPEAAKPAKVSAADLSKLRGELRADLKADLAELKAALKAELRAELKAEIVEELRILVIETARDVAGERTEQSVEQVLVRAFRGLMSIGAAA